MAWHGVGSGGGDNGAARVEAVGEGGGRGEVRGGAGGRGVEGRMGGEKARREGRWSKGRKDEQQGEGQEAMVGAERGVVWCGVVSCVVCGVWCGVVWCGVWCVVCGVWCVVCVV